MNTIKIFQNKQVAKEQAKKTENLKSNLLKHKTSASD